MAGHDHHQRLAVGRQLRQLRRRERAVGAGPVLDDHRLVPGLLQLLADVARDDVGGAAGRKADQDLDRAVRVALRRGRPSWRRGSIAAASRMSQSTSHVMRFIVASRHRVFAALSNR